MLVFRSFAIGLSAACFALLVMRPSIVVVHDQPFPEPGTVFVDRATRESTPPATVVDAARGITISQLLLAIRLAPDEQIHAINDIPVQDNVGAGMFLARHDPSSLALVDFVVSGPAGERRVLVVIH
jgi:hypothetical protein